MPEEEIIVPDAEEIDTQPDVEEKLEEEKQVYDTAAKSFGLKADILKDKLIPDAVKKLVNIDAIMQDPDEPPEVVEQKQLGELLKEGKLPEAIQKGFDILVSALIGKKKEIGLNHFKKYLIETQPDGQKIEDMTDEQISQSIDRLRTTIDNSTLSASQKLRFTYSLSRLLDQQKQRETKKPMTSMEILASNIKPGDVLLANKNKTENIKNLLSTKTIQYAQNDIWVHAMIVEKVDPDGTIHIIHSTTDKGADGKNGVQRGTLGDYIHKYKGGDILSLKTDEKHAQSLLTNAEKRLGFGYGFDDIQRAATRDAVDKNPNTVSCVTLIADSLREAHAELNDLKDVHFPKDIISSLHFTPSYMTTIVPGSSV